MATGIPAVPLFMASPLPKSKLTSLQVRICFCGDEGTGKSSLITSLVKDVFVTNKIQPVLPQITIPPSIGTPENVTTTIVDTSALPHERTELNKEIRKSNVILLVYSDHYSYERVALFWLPHFRSLGVNVPVVLCANKSDLSPDVNTDQVVEDEFLPVMAEYKEIDSCIRTSAREHHNINEVFFLCQKAVTDPIAPLFDSKESTLKQPCVAALERIFWLSDKDQNGYLDDNEMQDFQTKCFGKSLGEEDLENIKQAISKYSPELATAKGITREGFVHLNHIFASKGRHETIWLILRTHHYTNSLSLAPTYISPKFVLAPNTSAELSPAGYRFFVDLFLLFDKDNDGGLSPTELTALFVPTPGLPPDWDAGLHSPKSFTPTSTVRNEANYITLQGWLAQWATTTFFHPRTTLAYLAHLGYDPPDHNTTSALSITKPRKRTSNKRSRPAKTERQVLLAYILGPPGSGKSSLLDAFLSQPFTFTYHPTLKPRLAINSVELPGGKQCTLILEELGELEPAILDNPARLQAADLIVYAYDSSDPDSFAYVPALLTAHPGLVDIPSLCVALKADMDRCMQRGEVQPEDWTGEVGIGKPVHVSVQWGSIQEVFVQVAEAALWPVGKGLDGEEGREIDWIRWGVVGGAVIVVGAAAVGIWRRVSRD